MIEGWNQDLRRRLWEGKNTILNAPSSGRLYSLALSLNELEYVIQALDAFEKPVAVMACQDSAALSQVVFDVSRRLKAVEDWRRRWVGFVDDE